MLRLLEVFSKAAQYPGQSPRNSVLAGGGGTGCNRTMSQRLGASRTPGAPGLSVICQEGRLGRSSPPGTSLQGRNASLAAPRSRLRVGPPGSPLPRSAPRSPPFLGRFGQPGVALQPPFPPPLPWAPRLQSSASTRRPLPSHHRSFPRFPLLAPIPLSWVLGSLYGTPPSPASVRFLSEVPNPAGHLQDCLPRAGGQGTPVGRGGGLAFHR